MQTKEVRTEHLRIVAESAKAIYRKIPKGMGIDLMDLESAGNAALAEAIRKFSDLGEVHFENKMRIMVKNRMTDEIRRLSHRGKASAVGLPEDEDGGAIAIRDGMADDPAAMCEAGEEVDGVLARYERLPSPVEVAAKAASLKAAILDSVSAVDVREIIEMQVKKAKAGSLRSAQFVMGIVNGQ